MTSKVDLDVLHACGLLRYRVPYLASSTSIDLKKNKNSELKTTTSVDPDLQRQALSRMVRVKPECGVLKRKNVNFR